MRLSRYAVPTVAIALVTACTTADRPRAAGIDPAVSYADPSTLRVLPFPSIEFEPAGLADSQRRKDLTEHLALPLIRASRRPIALVLFTFDRARSDRIGVNVYWVGGGYHLLLLDRKNGKDPDFSAYEPYLNELNDAAQQSD